MKENPLIAGVGLQCIISNPSKWIDTFGDHSKTSDDWTSLGETVVPEINEYGIIVKGCSIEFPSDDIKMLFLLKYGP